MGVVGAARACYEAALAYATTRMQWGRPIAGFQFTQEKMVNIALEIQRAQLLATHLGALKDAGALAPAHLSFGKLNNVREALAIAREARTILGASGITLDYPIMRHMKRDSHAHHRSSVEGSRRVCVSTGRVLARSYCFGHGTSMPSFVAAWSGQ